MSIEEYTRIVFYFYLGIFLFSVLIGFIEILRRLWKKTSKFWLGIVPCAIFYSFSAALSTFSASIAYDDIADPNYMKYKDWGLTDFILHDIKTFFIWLFISILLYFVFGRESTKKSIKKAFAVILGVLIILFVLFLQLMMVP